MMKNIVSMIVILSIFLSSTMMVNARSPQEIKPITSDEITKLFEPGISDGKQCKKMDDTLKDMIDVIDTLSSSATKTKDVGVYFINAGEGFDAKSQGFGVLVDILAKFTETYLTAVQADELTKDFFSQQFDTLKLLDKKDAAGKTKVLANVIRNTISIGCNSKANYNMYKARSAIYRNIQEQVMSSNFIQNSLYNAYSKDFKKSTELLVDIMIINTCLTNFPNDKIKSLTKPYREGIDNHMGNNNSLLQIKNYYLTMIDLNSNIFNRDSAKKEFLSKYNPIEKTISRNKQSDYVKMYNFISDGTLKYNIGKGCSPEYHDYAISDNFTYSTEYKDNYKQYEKEKKDVLRKNPKLTKAKDINKEIIKTTKNDSVKQIARGYISGK